MQFYLRSFRGLLPPFILETDGVETPGDGFAQRASQGWTSWAKRSGEGAALLSCVPSACQIPLLLESSQGLGSARSHIPPQFWTWNYKLQRQCLTLGHGKLGTWSVGPLPVGGRGGRGPSRALSHQDRHSRSSCSPWVPAGPLSVILSVSLPQRTSATIPFYSGLKV